MDISMLTRSVLRKRGETFEDHSLLVGISGIDASGKGYIATYLTAELETAGHRVALVNVDGWLNLPAVRFLQSDAPRPKSHQSDGAIFFSETEEGRHFYDNALRLDEMFDRLILPLKADREIDLKMDFTDETATEFRPHTYRFKDIDIILLEGIFIFKRIFVQHFDLKIWIDCSLETALKRALARGQENLPADETVAAYQTIYFPAQKHHLAVDDPVHQADVIFPNE